MKVRLTQLDGGKMPNLALMKLAAYHRERGDEVVLARNPRRSFAEQDDAYYGRVYGSVIFTRSWPIVEHFMADFPEAIVGGTGLAKEDSAHTVEDLIRAERFEYHDYSIYPEFEHSVGFSMRGCRLACGFCVVPWKEGKARANARLHEIWRGPDYPKNICLLDNDFFGQPKVAWRSLLDAASEGKFRLCFNQGINVRLIRDDETAEAIASAPYYDDDFKVRRIYTAFDNAGDEPIFRKGVERLFSAGVKPQHVLSYMLVGWDEKETWEHIWRRFDTMLEYGILPYPMVYQRAGGKLTNNSLSLLELRQFQRWIIRRHYHVMSFEDFKLCSEGRKRDLHNANRLELIA